MIVLNLKSLTAQNILTSRHDYHTYCYINVEVAGREGKMRTGEKAKNTTRGIVRIKIIKLRQKEKRGKARK